MSKRALRFVAFIFLTALFTIPAIAQFGAVEGNVKDVDGKPAVGASIVIDRMDMKGHWETKTDKKGHYYYGGLPLGKFKVALQVDKKDVDAVSGLPIGMGDPIKQDFDMKQAQMRQQAAAAGIAVPSTTQAGGQAPKISKEEMAKIQEAQAKREEAMKKNAALLASFNAGKAALDAKDCQEAVSQFNIAAQADATQSAVFANLGESYNCLSRKQSGDERKDSLAKAEDAYQKALALKTDDGAIHHNMGLVMVSEGKIPEGIAELNKATQLDPANAGKYFFNLGAVLTNQGKIDEAAAAFQSAIKADPNYSEAYYQLGTALMGKASLDPKTGKITAAPGTIEGFQKYLELSPNGPNAAVAKEMIATLGGTLETEVKVKTDKNATKKKP
jgi:tetratricopeptide (TPR) repeat protein